jgi:hypothetical protein
MKKRKSRKPLTEARKPRVLIVFFSIIAAMLAIAVIWDQWIRIKEKPTLDLTASPTSRSLSEINNMDELRAMYERENTLDSDEESIKIAALTQLVAIAKRAQEVAQTEDDRNWGLEKELKSLSLLHLTLLRSHAISLAKNFEQDLIAATNRAKTSNLLVLKQLGHNAEVVYQAALIFSGQQTEPDLSSFRQSLIEYRDQQVEPGVLQAAVGQLLDLFTINAPTSKKTRNVIQIAAEVIAGAQAPELQTWAAELSDQVILLDIEFPALRSECDLGHVSARDRFLERYKIALPNLKTTRAIENLLPMGTYFERHSWYQSAREFYDDLRQKLTQLPSNDLHATVDKRCVQGLQRLKMANQRLELLGQDVAGQALSATLATKPVVLMIFLYDPSFASLLPFKYADMAGKNANDLRVIFVIRKSKQPNAIDSDLAIEWPDAVQVVETELSQPISAQFPIEVYPYAILLDRQQHVTRINPDLGTLLSEIERLTRTPAQ